MPRAIRRSSHLVWGAVALGLVACATAADRTEGDDAGVVPGFEAGVDTGPGQSDAQPLVPGDTGVPDDTGTQDALASDAAGEGSAGDAALDTGAPDAFDGGACAKAPPSNLCGLDPQCGCGAGTCDIDRTVTTGATVCTSAGATLRGRACTTTSECMQGDTCESGACRPFCTTVNAACNKTGTGKCVQSGLASVAVPNFKVCEIECALQDPNACGGAGVGCVFDDTTSGTDCAAVGTATTCSASSSTCSAGNVCLDTGGGTYGCYRWCRRATADCGAAATCQALAVPVVVNGQEYGACL